MAKNKIVRALWGPMSRIGLLWMVAAFCADQFHKTWMLNVTGITEGEHIAITPFLDIVLIWNRGISYGMFQQHDLAGRLTLAGLSVLAVVALGVWLAKSYQTRMTAISIGLIMGGALGNALDRLIRPGVADFFSLHAFSYSWYVFNIADVAIVAGVVGLLYDSLLQGRKTASKTSQD